MESLQKLKEVWLMWNDLTLQIWIEDRVAFGAQRHFQRFVS